MQPREYRANNAEPSDVKSPLSRRTRKEVSASTAHPRSVFHLYQGPGSGLRGWMTEGSLTTGVNLRFLFANSSRKQHDDAAISSASPLPTT